MELPKSGRSLCARKKWTLPDILFIEFHWYLEYLFFIPAICWIICCIKRWWHDETSSIRRSVASCPEASHCMHHGSSWRDRSNMTQLWSQKIIDLMNLNLNHSVLAVCLDFHRKNHQCALGHLAVGTFSKICMVLSCTGCTSVATLGSKCVTLPSGACRKCEHGISAKISRSYSHILPSQQIMWRFPKIGVPNHPQN